MAKGGGTSPSKKRYYEEYKRDHIREKNKILKIQRHLKDHPNDQKSLSEIARLQDVINK
jgi:hypothetical protein